MRAYKSTAFAIGVSIVITGCDVLNKDDQKGSNKKSCTTGIPLLSTPPEDQQTLLDANVPYQAFPVLGAKKIGLLFTAGRQSWGLTFNHGRQLGEGDDGQIMYRFTTDASSPFVVYFKSAGEGFNYIPNWQVPISATEHVIYNAAQFGPETANTFGLSKLAHLVELVPNDGKGNNGVHFVPTDVKVLDGTAGYALDPVALMNETKTAFDQVIDDKAAAIIEKMTAAKTRDNPENVEATTKTETGMYPTWSTQDNALKLVMVYRQIESFSVTTEEELPDCPDGAPCMGGGQTITTTTNYGVEMVATYKFGADGAAIGEPVVSEPTVILAGKAAANTTTTDGPVSDDFEDGVGYDEDGVDDANKQPCL